MNIGLVYALKDEAQSLLDIFSNLIEIEENIYKAIYKENTLYIGICGIGKANAAYMTTKIKVKYNVEYIINSGNSGGLDKKLNLRDVVIVDNLNYHDFHSEALGFIPGQVPNMPSQYKTYGDFSKLKFVDFNIHIGDAISGDQFSFPNIAYPAKLSWPKALCIDMESCAIAQTCYKLKTPYICVRSIPDIAITGGNNFEIYLKNANEASKNANTVVLSIIDKIINCI